ncbi:sulfotransferase domain-containing protein [Moritella sp. 36]|uniref:sulfotransferase family protein n=1 Tax=Moritella sp. 36 TaxID=2746233 RepID=UPI001BACD002|nr:sulfotransferase domain-containing protein [Moritella sp. 36]QUM87886.1 sulfotransferase domain-containing protein [Moritella sp. 36]
MKRNIFVIGMPKNGTTSLSEWLDCYSEISVSSVKEPHYFLPKDNKHRSVKSKVEYDNTFNEECETRVDCSTLYCFYESTIEAISKLSNSKVVFIIREPLAFIKSHYAQQYSTFDEVEDNFNKAWDRSEPPKNEYCRDELLVSYKEVLNYKNIIENINRHFNPDSRLFIYYEDLINHQEDTLLKILSFIDIKNINENDFKLPFSNKMKRKPQLSRYLHTLNKENVFYKMFSTFNKNIFKGVFRISYIENVLSKYGKERVVEPLSLENEKELYEIMNKQYDYIIRQFGDLPDNWKPRN